MKRSTLVWLPALAFGVTGCTSWRVVTAPPPAQVMAQERPDKVLVTLSDGTLIVLRTPVVRGDTLIGHRSAGLVLSDTAREIPVPLAHVRTISLRRHSTGKTLGLIGGIIVGLSIVGGIGMAAE